MSVSTEPLPVLTWPEPSSRSPSQVARAVFSVAIVLLFFSGAGRAIVPAASQLLGEEVELESARVFVGVDVALAAPQLARAVVVRVAERVRGPHVPVLAYVGRRLLQRHVGRIRLRRSCQVDRGLGQVEPGLRQP